MTKVLKREGYELLYDETHALPRYVAYHLLAIGAPGDRAVHNRSDKFLTDFETEVKIAPSEYDRPELKSYERGHMAPSYGIGTRYGEAAERETFLLSNIVPQSGSVNRGAWRIVEADEADWYANEYGEAWIIAGPIFDHVNLGDRECRVTIPKNTYKVILVIADHRPAVLAYLFPNDPGLRPSKDEALTSVDNIERLAELDLFPSLEDRLEKRIESARSSKSWLKHQKRQ